MKGQSPTQRLGARIVCAALAAGCLSADARAGESDLEDQPIPDSTREIPTPMRRVFTRPETKQPLFSWVSNKMRDLPAFFSDGELQLKLRTYYMFQNLVGEKKSEAWAGGGSLYLRSGYLADLFAVEVEGFTSQPAIAPSDRDGTLLLAPGQKGYSALGVANARLKHWHTEIVGWRQYMDLPYVNRRDNRMTPQSFEGVTLLRDVEEIPFAFVGGYLWRIKLRNGNSFESFPEVLVPGLHVEDGIDAERGMALAGILWQRSEDLTAGALSEYVPDLFNTVYSELAWDNDLVPVVDGKFELQFTWQSSVGRELASSFDTWNAGFRISASGKGGVARLAFVATGKAASILNPWGSSPSYVNLMQRTFNLANEKALLASLSYDFAGIGLENVAGILNFAAGWDGRLLDGPARNKQEVNLTLDYRITEGWLENFWLRLRGSWLHEEGFAEDGLDFRVILNYDLPVL